MPSYLSQEKNNKAFNLSAPKQILSFKKSPRIPLKLRVKGPLCITIQFLHPVDQSTELLLCAH